MCRNDGHPDVPNATHPSYGRIRPGATDMVGAIGSHVARRGNQVFGNALETIQ